MNIYNYIDDYGVYSFDEKEINDVDCVIFSFLSYANFTDILGNNKKITIKDAGRMHLGMHPNKDKNVIAVKEGNKLLRYLKDTKRFKNCILSNYEYVGEHAHENNTKFTNSKVFPEPGGPMTSDK